MELVVLRWCDDYELLHDLFSWRICSGWVCTYKVWDERKDGLKDEIEGLRQQKNAVWQRLREPVWQLSTLCVRTSHTPEKHASSYHDLTIMMDNAAALGITWQEEFHFHYAL